MAMSMASVRSSGDFEEAKSRYENCGSHRWKSAWWEIVCEIYDSSKTWAKKYVLDRVAKVIRLIGEKITAARRRKTVTFGLDAWSFGDTEIKYLNGTEALDTKSGEKAYHFKFYENDTKPVFDKIGTTTKSCMERLKQEIRYYNDKAGFDIRRVEICAIHDCGEEHAEGFESFMRSILMKRFPNTWKRNDRFFGTDIPPEEFNNLCAQYAAL